MSKQKHNSGKQPMSTVQGGQQSGQQDQSQDQEQKDQGEQSQQQEDQQNDTGGEQQSSDVPAGDKTGDQETEEKKNPPQDPVPEVKAEVKAEAEAPAPKTKQEGFVPVYKVELEMTSYAEAMDNKKTIVPEEGGKWQLSLFNTIKSILNAKDQEEFNKEWGTLLMFFHKNKDGIFNENFIFRFPEYWPGSTTEFTTFRRIVYMILQTADVKTRRKALNDVQMDLVGENLTQPQRQKLMNFYQV